MKKIFPAIILIAFIAGCKKYPEDDKFHLSTAKSRLTNTWQPREAHNFISNKDIYFNSYDAVYFLRDGSIGGEICASPLYAGLNPPFGSCKFYGRWEFINKKNKLKLTNSNNKSGEYSIIKLDYDELWIQGDSTLFKFIPKPK